MLILLCFMHSLIHCLMEPTTLGILNVQMPNETVRPPHTRILGCHLSELSALLLSAQNNYGCAGKPSA